MSNASAVTTQGAQTMEHSDAADPTVYAAADSFVALGNAPSAPAPTGGKAPTSPPCAQPVVPARRVGTITMGTALIATGVLLCVSMFYPSFEVWLLFRFAPLLLILLGAEILISHALAKTAPIKYDILSLFLCTLLILFAFGVTSVSAALLYKSGFYSILPSNYHFTF